MKASDLLTLANLLKEFARCAPQPWAAIATALASLAVQAITEEMRAVERSQAIGQAAGKAAAESVAALKKEAKDDQ